MWLRWIKLLPCISKSPGVIQIRLFFDLGCQVNRPVVDSDGIGQHDQAGSCQKRFPELEIAMAQGCLRDGSGQAQEWQYSARRTDVSFRGRVKGHWAG
ncbi:MAG: hypothetical protein BM562_15775 [Alphaproteobacteria bacterium MedPE-SWcel]|nr:MAG: hypothetical protein BM562_15775 [Alphaproteobacteria bacterium MedPE-SWcel]